MARKADTYRGARRDAFGHDGPWPLYTLPQKVARRPKRIQPKGVDINATRLILTKSLADAGLDMVKYAHARFAQIMFQLTLVGQRVRRGAGRVTVHSQKRQDRSAYRPHRGALEVARLLNHPDDVC